MSTIVAFALLQLESGGTYTAVLGSMTVIIRTLLNGLTYQGSDARPEKEPVEL